MHARTRHVAARDPRLVEHRVVLAPGGVEQQGAVTLDVVGDVDPRVEVRVVHDLAPDVVPGLLLLRPETEVDHPVVADREAVANVEADVPDLRVAAAAADAGADRADDLAVDVFDLGRPVRQAVGVVALAGQERRVVVDEVAAATARRRSQEVRVLGRRRVAPQERTGVVLHCPGLVVPEGVAGVEAPAVEQRHAGVLALPLRVLVVDAVLQLVVGANELGQADVRLLTRERVEAEAVGEDPAVVPSLQVLVVPVHVVVVAGIEDAQARVEREPQWIAGVAARGVRRHVARDRTPIERLRLQAGLDHARRRLGEVVLGQPLENRNAVDAQDLGVLLLQLVVAGEVLVLLGLLEGDLGLQVPVARDGVVPVDRRQHAVVLVRRRRPVIRGRDVEVVPERRRVHRRGGEGVARRRLHVQLEDARLVEQADVVRVAADQPLGVRVVELADAEEEPELVPLDRAADREFEVVGGAGPLVAAGQAGLAVRREQLRTQVAGGDSPAARVPVVAVATPEPVHRIRLVLPFVEGRLILVVGAPIDRLALPERVGVPAVRARLDDYVGRGADVAAVLGGGAAGLHRDLGERRGRQEDAAAAELGERRVDAVDVDALVGEVGAVDRRARLLDVVVLRVGGDARQGVDDAVVRPRGAGGLLADLGRHGAARGDVELVDHRRLAGDGYLALDRRLQRQVEVLPVAGRGVEFGRGLPQALQFGLQVVGAGHDANEPELAVLVRDRELVAALTGQGDADARKRRASRVNDRAADGCGLRCVGKCAERDQQRQDHCESLHRASPRIKL